VEETLSEKEVSNKNLHISYRLLDERDIKDIEIEDINVVGRPDRKRGTRVFGKKFENETNESHLVAIAYVHEKFRQTVGREKQKVSDLLNKVKPERNRGEGVTEADLKDALHKVYMGIWEDYPELIFHASRKRNSEGGIVGKVKSGLFTDDWHKGVRRGIKELEKLYQDGEQAFEKSALQVFVEKISKNVPNQKKLLRKVFGYMMRRNQGKALELAQDIGAAKVSEWMEKGTEAQITDVEFDRLEANERVELSNLLWDLDQDLYTKVVGDKQQVVVNASQLNVWTRNFVRRWLKKQFPELAEDHGLTESEWEGEAGGSETEQDSSVRPTINPNRAQARTREEKIKKRRILNAIFNRNNKYQRRLRVERGDKKLTLAQVFLEDYTEEERAGIKAFVASKSNVLKKRGPESRPRRVLKKRLKK